MCLELLNVNKYSYVASKDGPIRIVDDFEYQLKKIIKGS